MDGCPNNKDWCKHSPQVDVWDFSVQMEIYLWMLSVLILCELTLLSWLFLGSLCSAGIFFDLSHDHSIMGPGVLVQEPCWGLGDLLECADSSNPGSKSAWKKIFRAPLAPGRLINLFERGGMTPPNSAINLQRPTIIRLFDYSKLP